jgi:sulfite exporter TauE/SafE
MFKTLFFLFFLGFSFGCGPCLASCGPLIISYIAGTKKNIFKSIFAYTLFSLARITVYVVLSLVIFFLGRLFLEQYIPVINRYVVILGSSFIILVGILMVLGKRTDFYACCFFREHILENDKKSIFALGLITGLLPCAPLLATFSYIAMVSRFWLDSLFYSFFFGLGTFFSPLLLLVMLAGLIPRFLITKKAFYSRIFCCVCGLIMVFLGVELLRTIF